MSSISIVNASLNKFFIPEEVQRIIFEYLTIEDYDRPRARFNRIFLNRMSLNYPSLTLFNSILRDRVNIKENFLRKFPVMKYIYNKIDKYLNKETDFYSVYDYDDVTGCGMDFYTLEGGYVPIPSLLEFVDEDDEYSDIKPVEGYDNIEILAETFREFRVRYTDFYDRGHGCLLVFKFNDTIYKTKIFEAIN